MARSLSHNTILPEDADVEVKQPQKRDCRSSKDRPHLSLRIRNLLTLKIPHTHLIPISAIRHGEIYHADYPRIMEQIASRDTTTLLICRQLSRFWRFLRRGTLSACDHRETGHELCS